MPHDRRNFLKTTGAAVSAVAVGACRPASSPVPASPRALSPEVLRAIAPVVLPSELGDEGQKAAIRDFERWVEAYEAVPELDHGYGTAEIRYGPGDPAPAWQSQLEALETESQKRFARGFPELDESDREWLLRRHVSDEGPGMPPPLAARHVAVALLSHWLRSPDATDRCYNAEISPLTCRGVPGVSQEPGERT